MIVPTSSLYKLAYSTYAVGAYNINNLEQILGLFKGCIDSQAPFIIQISKGARKYADKRMLEAIKERIPGTPIVMHGSSSVPEEEVRRINAAGGKLDPSARGVDEDEYLPAARLGVTKINIDTDGRLVWTRVHREYFRDHPDQFDLRPPG